MKKLFACAAVITLAACQGSVTFNEGSGGTGGNSSPGGAGGESSTTTGSGGSSQSSTTNTSSGVGGTLSTTTGGGGCEDLAIPVDPTHDPADIIFVVDNSASMAEETAGLEANLYTHLSQPATAAGIDHRIVVVASHGSGPFDVCIQAPLSGTNNCAGQPINVPDQFYHYSVNVQSHNALCKLLNTFWGNEADQWNLAPGGWSEWVRPDALKAIVALTDDGTSCTWNGNNFNDGNNIATGQQTAIDFDQQLISLAPMHFGTQAERNYVFYSLIGLAPPNPNMPNEPWGPAEPVTTNECAGAVDPGTAYQWLSKGTNGLRFSLCNTGGYNSMFQSIASDLEQQTENLCLLHVPEEILDLNTMTIVYEPGDNSTPMELTRVLTADQCGPNHFYIENNLTHICPVSCAAIKADPNPQLTNFVDCPTPDI